MKTFVIIWFGQFISRIGTAMTRFALLIWTYEQSGSATSVAMLGFAAFVPMILVSPLAGVWIDRFDRRKILILSDLGAGLMTIAMLLLTVSGQLQLWHLYLAEALAGAFEAFQAPAYTAVASTLLPRAQYSRGNGLRALAEHGATVLAPALGGLCLAAIGLGGVLALDVITFLVAVATLLVVRVPLVDADSAPSHAGLQRDMQVGFRVIWQHKGLAALVAISTAVHFFAAITWLSIMPAMILARSGGNEFALAGVQSAMGVAGVLGGLLMSVWGGPRRKIHGFLLGVTLSFLLGDIPLALGRSLPVWMAAAGFGAFFIPILISSRETIWQARIPLQMQGRVFSARNMLSNALLPAGYVLGGVLADRVLEPAMAAGGRLTPVFGGLVGSGPGTGMALMFLTTAVLAISICLAAYLVPAIRNVEDEEVAPLFPNAAAAAAD